MDCLALIRGNKFRLLKSSKPIQAIKKTQNSLSFQSLIKSNSINIEISHFHQGFFKLNFARFQIFFSKLNYNCLPGSITSHVCCVSVCFPLLLIVQEAIFPQNKVFFIEPNEQKGCCRKKQRKRHRRLQNLTTNQSFGEAYNFLMRFSTCSLQFQWAIGSSSLNEYNGQT